MQADCFNYFHLRECYLFKPGERERQRQKHTDETQTDRDKERFFGSKRRKRDRQI